jgi:hypothetical protein
MASNDPHAGEEKPDTVTVTWSEERFAPVQYHSFGIGPFWMTTKIRPDETPEQAMERAYTALDAVARRLYSQKRKGFFERLDAKDEPF